MRRAAAPLVLVLILAVFAPLATAARLGVSIANTCSQINAKHSACDVQAMCQQCVSASDCEFNLLDLECESKTATASANGTTTRYCSSNDSACSSCTVSSAKPTCTGEDGECICPSLCSIVTPSVSDDCSSVEGSTIMYAGTGCGVFCVALVLYLVRKCKSRRAMLVMQEELAARRRRESEMLHARLPHLALELNGWRDYVELHKPELHKLGMCYYLMNQSDTREEQREAVHAVGAEESGPGHVDSNAASLEGSCEAQHRLEAQEAVAERKDPYIRDIPE
ncbi:hypothetical protein BBJ28_00004377 [Nothophytophthora sp. Chile5]|nr:hypothetical protein BBJ28_00004377 [Nothophytophthora sp. Chile5]